MNGEQHAAEAERLIAEHEAKKHTGVYTITPWQLTIAHIHATLALYEALKSLKGEGRHA